MKTYKSFKCHFPSVMGLFMIFTGLSVNANLKMTELKLNLSTTVPQGDWILNENPVFNGPKALAPAAEMMIAERKRDFLGCSKKGRIAFEKIPEFRGWIFIEALNCLGILPDDQNEKTTELSHWTKLYNRNSSVFEAQLQFQNTVDKLLVEVMSVLSSTEGKAPARLELLEWVLDRKMTLSREQKGEFFKLMGAYLEADKKNNEAAVDYYLRAQDLVPSSKVKERLLALGWKKEVLVIEPLKNEESTSADKLDEIFRKNQAQNIIDSTLKFLEQYPNGVKTQSFSDRMINLYVALFERENGNSDILKTSIDSLLRAHSDRLIEWAKVLHRKGDYYGARELARKALVDNEAGPNGAALLYILGRTSHFLGDYRAALSYFSKMAERHSSYSEIAEVKYRIGLIQLRLEDYDKAEISFRALIDRPENKPYDLSAKYWLIRALQKNKKEASKEIDQLLQSYTLSYYGLKLLAENNSGKIEWDLKNPPNPKVSLFLTTNEMQSWEKAQRLSQAGFVYAASEELKNLYIPPTAEGRLTFARIFANYFSFPMAIRLLTEGLDLDTSYRHPEIIKVGFPFVFKTTIEKEAAKYKLSPWVVLGLIRQESAFLLRAQSGSQAQGLMQMIPATAKEIAEDLKVKTFKPTDIFSPELNIQFGTYYISKMIRRFGNNIPVALAAYNAGPQRLKRFIDGREDLLKTESMSQADLWTDLWVEELPWYETNLYVKAILRNAIIYQVLDRKKMDWPSPVWGPLVQEDANLVPSTRR